jgi:hypothetical protein
MITINELIERWKGLGNVTISLYIEKDREWRDYKAIRYNLRYGDWVVERVMNKEGDDLGYYYNTLDEVSFEVKCPHCNKVIEQNPKEPQSETDQ